MEETPLTPATPVRAYLGLGANLGDPAATMRAARVMIDHMERTHVVAAASLYRTTPVGYADQPDFLNTVIAVETSLAAPVFFRAIKEIERVLGRKERPRWHEREIDIDLLVYGDEVLEWDGVVVPHPRMAERRFVLVPFAEIAPGVIPAGQERDIKELLSACTDTGEVLRIGPLDEPL